MASTKYADQQKALNKRLSDFQSTNIAWEGAGYNPTPGTTYLEPLFFPGRPSQATLGPNGGQNEHTGIYIINVKAPAGDGWDAGGAIADNIADHFKRGTTLTYNGQKVRIRKSWVDVGTTQGDRYVVPVNVEWFAFIDN